MNTSHSVWADVRGYEGLYEVSLDGRVRSTSKTVNCAYGKTRFMRGCERKPATDKKGYKRIDLYRDDKRETWLVHRIVMMAFMFTEGHKSLDINHIDGNPSNNEISNLEWCTHQENIQHAFSVLKKGNSKAVSSFCRTSGKLIKSYQKIIHAQIDGYKCSGISRCALGKRRSYKGLVWQFV